MFCQVTFFGHLVYHLYSAKYAMGKETITKYQNEPLYDWIIPKDQREPGVTELFLNKLVALDLEVFVAETPFEAEGY